MNTCLYFFFISLWGFLGGGNHCKALMVYIVVHNTFSAWYIHGFYIYLLVGARAVAYRLSLYASIPYVLYMELVTPLLI